MKRPRIVLMSVALLIALLPERRAALERWAKHIKGLTADKPAKNVVDLALNRRRSK